MPVGLLRRRAVSLVPARLQRDLRFRCWEVPAAVPWKERGVCVFCPAWSRWLLPGVLLPVGSGPAEEDIASGGGYLQVIVLIVGYLKVAELQHL